MGRQPQELPSRTGAQSTRSSRGSRRRRPQAIDAAIGVRRPLARLGMGLHRRHRQFQGDDIDIDAAVEARVEVRAGSVPDEAVYLDSLRRQA